MDVNNPRRSLRSTPSKYKLPTKVVSTPTKPTSSSLSEVPDNPDNTESNSGSDNTPKKSTPGKKPHFIDDSDSDVVINPKKNSPNKKSKTIDDDSVSEEQQPSSTVKNTDKRSAPRGRRGLRDLKITGPVSMNWSSDESDDFPAVSKLGMSL